MLNFLTLDHREILQNAAVPLAMFVFKQTASNVPCHSIYNKEFKIVANSEVKTDGKRRVKQSELRTMRQFSM